MNEVKIAKGYLKKFSNYVGGSVFKSKMWDEFYNDPSNRTQEETQVARKMWVSLASRKRMFGSGKVGKTRIYTIPKGQKLDAKLSQVLKPVVKKSVVKKSVAKKPVAKKSEAIAAMVKSTDTEFVTTRSVNRSSAVTDNFVPAKIDGFVANGHYSDMKKVIAANQFYPMYIVGHSGNGKTVSVQQACAETKRELFRVNITVETDEDDLIGGFRLINGETVWNDGPVITAMRRGGVVLLDEVDLASNKIMCLQPILEGNGVLLKKINEFVKPAAGFTVVATANTKGRGSEDGRYIGTNILNEAFLERFPIMFDTQYASESVEKKILAHHCDDKEFIEKLAVWSAAIRKSFDEGSIDNVITTRRLVHIVTAYNIFGNRMKAIEYTTSRFEPEVNEAFIDLYTKVDENVQQYSQESGE
jgi:hypothetical protein